MTGKIKLPHASGNSMSIAAPATNPASDLTLQLPNSVGTGKINHGNVLEQFYTPCDGSAITVPSGTYTVSNVTAEQNLTTTYADVTGSSIAYTPPAGTTQVIYRFKYHWARDGDTSARASFRFYIDSDEVTNARWANGAGGGAGLQGHSIFEWGINIGGSAATATGRQASWSSAKTLKIQAREYTSSAEETLHNIFYWDGSETDTFSQPSIGITAIGTPA